MRAQLNMIMNPLLIKINENCDFAYLEENLEIDSPVKNYYFKYIDLSLNISLKLKWALHGYFFFASILETIDDPDYIDGFSLEESISNNLPPKKKKIFLVDEVEMLNISDFIKEMENEYNKIFYNSNSIMHFKLKLNIEEFVLLQNAMIPVLVYYKE